MALNTKLPIFIKNIQLNALASYVNDGFLRIYSGAQPNSPDYPITTQTLLAELRMSSVAFAPAVGGSITANLISTASAINTGVAIWFRIFAADGVTALIDGSVGTSDSNAVLNSVNIFTGASVTITALIHSIL